MDVPGEWIIFIPWLWLPWHTTEVLGGSESLAEMSKMRLLKSLWNLKWEKNVVGGRSIHVAFYYLNICVGFLLYACTWNGNEQQGPLTSACDCHQCAIQLWVNQLFFGVIFRNRKKPLNKGSGPGVSTWAPPSLEALISQNTSWHLLSE